MSKDTYRIVDKYKGTKMVKEQRLKIGRSVDIDLYQHSDCDEYEYDPFQEAADKWGISRHEAYRFMCEYREHLERQKERIGIGAYIASYALDYDLDAFKKAADRWGISEDEASECYYEYLNNQSRSFGVCEEKETPSLKSIEDRVSALEDMVKNTEELERNIEEGLSELKVSNLERIEGLNSYDRHYRGYKWYEMEKNPMLYAQNDKYNRGNKRHEMEMNPMLHAPVIDQPTSYEILESFIGF